jgi:hypothetical protein
MHTYCVVLRPMRSLTAPFLRMKRYYLRAKTAAQAMLLASEDPHYTVLGVEPAALSARTMQARPLAVQREVFRPSGRPTLRPAAAARQASAAEGTFGRTEGRILAQSQMREARFAHRAGNGTAP